MAWIFEKDKKFIILGNQNSVTYKEIFPLIKENKIWYGAAIHSGSVIFKMPVYLKIYSKKVFIKEGQKYINIPFVRWFTNVKHGVARKNLNLYSMAHNLKFNKKLRKKLEKDYGKIEYPHYDNYDAIEVPFTICIPSDYDGVMGVPITFLDKYNPGQFELIKFRHGNDNKDLCVNGMTPYFRILIQPTEQFEIVGATGYDDTPCRISRDYKALGYRFYKKDGVTESGSGALRDKTSGKIKCKGNGDYSVSPNGEFLSAVYFRVFICPTEQFEIVGEANHGKDSKYDLFAPSVDKKAIFKRLIIQPKNKVSLDKNNTSCRVVRKVAGGDVCDCRKNKCPSDK